ncbi:MAG: cytochrome c [Bacteroidota bacterium]|nr:cytochrome c [Bacteroidota bacterium]
MRQTLKTLLILIVVFITGCYYDNEEKLYSEVSTNCDLSNVTFVLTVTPILQASCLSCHSNSKAGSSGGGVKLQNYADVQVQAKNGKLMGVVKHASGFQEMPQGGGKLPDCEISKLQKWIDSGTLNN